MPDDKSGSRGPDGSPCDPDGLGIPSRSAPASSRDLLIRHLKFALDASRDGEKKGWWLNMALLAVEGAIQAWRAETPLVRPPSPPLGRPPVVEGDAQTLLNLRAANPHSDCRVEFEKWTGASKQRARIRYQDADAWAAELKAMMASSSGKPP
jgi:hypothetical protein